MTQSLKPLTSRLLVSLLSSALLTMASTAAGAETLNAAGSSAAALMYRSWASAYGKQNDFKLNYEASGSTAGLKKIRAREVAFGASDVAPSEQEMNRDELVLVPTFVTGAVPVVNLPKIGKGKLRLTGELIADIYMGNITRWNAPELVALNPDLGLPDLPIHPIGRSDGSGTTYYVTDFLSKVSPSWKARFGTKTSIPWVEQVKGAKGSDGMAKAVQETPGAIGYVDFNYINEFSLNPAQVRNASGEFVSATVGGFRAALRASDWQAKGDFHASLAYLPGGNVWPITMGTFILLPKVSKQQADTSSALRFLMWALLKGDQVVEGLSFVRLPDSLQATAFKALTSVTDPQGKKLGVEAFSAMTQQ